MQFLLLYGVLNNTARTIQVGSIGAIDADNRHSHGYYMVEFTSFPYTLKENKNMYGKLIESVDILSSVRYFSMGLVWVWVRP